MDLTIIKEAFQRASSEGIDWRIFVDYYQHIGEDLKTDKVEDFQDAHAGNAETLVDWCHQ